MTGRQTAGSSKAIKVLTKASKQTKTFVVNVATWQGDHFEFVTLLGARVCGRAAVSCHLAESKTEEDKIIVHRDKGGPATVALILER